MRLVLLLTFLAFPFFSASADDDYYDRGLRRGEVESKPWGWRRYEWHDDHQWRRRSPARRHNSAFERMLSEGVRRGELSRSEARELREKEYDLQRKESRYWADGRLSDRERRDLIDERDDLHDDLRHELNDGERRNSGGWLRFGF